MVLRQISIPEHLDKKLRLYMAKNKMTNKEKTMIALLEETLK